MDLYLHLAIRGVIVLADCQRLGILHRGSCLTKYLIAAGILLLTDIQVDVTALTELRLRIIGRNALPLQENRRHAALFKSSRHLSQDRVELGVSHHGTHHHSTHFGL